MQKKKNVNIHKANLNDKLTDDFPNSVQNRKGKYDRNLYNDITRYLLKYQQNFVFMIN